MLIRSPLSVTDADEEEMRELTLLDLAADCTVTAAIAMEVALEEEEEEEELRIFLVEQSFPEILGEEQCVVVRNDLQTLTSSG